MFTEREIKIIELRKGDLTQVEIAKKLKISQAAVSSFEKRIREKIADAKKTCELIKKLKIIQ